MRIAFVSTVKNEEDLIAANIRFHGFIGGTDFLIYIDNSSDQTEAIARTLLGVRIKRSLIPSHCKGTAKHASLNSKFRTHHTARQILNCYDAIEWGRHNSVDWIVSLDPDELICLDRNEIRRDMLAEFLGTLPNHVDAVTFPSLEVIPTRMAYREVFREERWFKRNYGFGEGMRFQSSDAVPNLEPGLGSAPAGVLARDEATYKWREASKAWNNHLLFDPDRDESSDYVLDVPPLMMSPNAVGHRLVTDWYTGHVIGKQAFRIDRDLRIVNLHKIQTNSGHPECMISAGWLLHYNNYSARKFVMKYRQSAAHPNSYSSGFPVDPAKRLLRDMVNHPSARLERLYGFFRERFLFDEYRLAGALDLWPHSVERIDAVAEFFEARRWGTV